MGPAIAFFADLVQFLKKCCRTWSHLDHQDGTGQDSSRQQEKFSRAGEVFTILADFKRRKAEP